MIKSDYKWSQTVKSDENCKLGMTLSNSFFYIFDLFSGNLKIDIHSSSFKVEDKDRKTTICLKKTKIDKLEFEYFDMDKLDSRDLIWILSLIYPTSQCRLVIYLFSYFLTLKSFSSRAIKGPYRGSANSLYYFWIFCFLFI